MGKRKWEVLYSKLKTLTKIEMVALKRENQQWLPSLDTMSVGPALANAIMKAMANKGRIEFRRRAAWFYCWLLTGRRHTGLWLFLRIGEASRDDQDRHSNQDNRGNKDDKERKDENKNDNEEDEDNKGPNPGGAVLDAESAFKDSAEYLSKYINCNVTVECIEKNGAVYACMLVKKVQGSTAKIYRAYLVISQNKTLLAIGVPRSGVPSLKRGLLYGLEATIPQNFAVKPWRLQTSYFDRALLERLQRNEQTVYPRRDSLAKGSTDEDSGDEDSTDEDCWDEDSLDDSGEEDPAQFEQMLKESVVVPLQEAPQPRSSNTSTTGASFMEVDCGVPFDQVGSQTSSSSDSKSGLSSRTRKRTLVVPVAGKDWRPGCSRDIEAWVQPGDRPAENAEDEVGATAPRQKRVSRLQVLKRAPGLQEGVPSKDSKSNVIKGPAEMDSQTTRRRSLRKPSGKKKGVSTERRTVYKKLEELWLEIAETRSQSEMEELKQILEDTYNQRRLIAASPLPEFFLQEEILCMEAKIRFGSDIKELEEKLRNALKIFSEAHNEEFPLEGLTLRDLCLYLEDGTSPSLVTERCVPKHITDDSPRIYTMGRHLWINAGTTAETIKIASGSLERALVLCLVLYYVKYLDYPEAFWRVLYVLQSILNPRDDPPTPPTGRNGQKCEVTEKMRCLVDLLTIKKETNESEKE
ncbi:uncharacterized protein LOC119185561 isoform X1 [Rhipicephalus microplus]|uniref:uncharacterized protein LOC119185561 isoform X1 n=1 Tax=Rhipicephalus microplus TaxID=6941 RepID=UPI003F6D546C